MTFTKLGLVAATAAAALFVVGSTGAEAAKKAKTMAPEPVCMWEPTSPVCAIKGGKRATYASKCFAANDGAWVVSNKACGKGGSGGGKKAAAKKKK